MSELRRIARNGHSLAIALPKTFLDALGWRHGQTLMIELDEGTLVISQAVSRHQATLLDPAPRGKRHVS